VRAACAAAAAGFSGDPCGYGEQQARSPHLPGTQPHLPTTWPHRDSAKPLGNTAPEHPTLFTYACWSENATSAATSAPKLGSPLPHLRRDWARAPGLGPPLCPHLRRDWARPSAAHICAGADWAHLAHVCTGTARHLPTSGAGFGLTPLSCGPTSAPGLAGLTPLSCGPTSAPGLTGLTPLSCGPTSAPGLLATCPHLGLGSPPPPAGPHLRRDWLGWLGRRRIRVLQGENDRLRADLGRALARAAYHPVVPRSTPRGPLEDPSRTTRGPREYRNESPVASGGNVYLRTALPHRSAKSRCRCGRGEPGPGADVGGVSPVAVQMWAG
jgi:hypothetical protein